MTAAENCDCGKPKPGPNGGKPRLTGASSRPKSLVASVGGGNGIVHVAPDGTRTPVTDLIAGRAAVARGGGSLDF